MKAFILKSFLFFVVFAGIVFGGSFITSLLVKERKFLNYETESNLLIMKNNVKYNLVITGISHARNFSRYKNHLRIENILKMSILNLGKGGGVCGANDQYFYLNHFYKKGNTADYLLYVLSPPIIFSRNLPVASNTFEDEPFEPEFFTDYMGFPSENKNQRLFYYLKAKLGTSWIYKEPYSLDKMDIRLEQLDSAKIKAGINLAYDEWLDSTVIEKNCKAIENTIQLALKNRTNVVFIIPPALFGKWKGHDVVVDFAHRMVKNYGISFYDHSETVLIPAFYYDHHHLNTMGIVYYTEKFLKPVLKLKTRNNPIPAGF